MLEHSRRDRKELVISVSTRGGAHSKYFDRPPPCLRCGTPAWWNGTRTVSSVRKGAGGSVGHGSGEVRGRARCPSKECSTGSWTVYEDDAYPHRTFRLEVVVSAVVQVVVVGATLTASAARHLCSRDSVRRWMMWIEGLCNPQELERLCMRIDPDGLPAAARTGSVAARVLQLFERLADLLALRGVALARRGAGLVRVLVHQLVRFGQVFRLTKLSPPLRADPTQVGG